MRRRNFIGSVAAAVAAGLLGKLNAGTQGQSKSIIKPAALEAGDKVAVIAPATSVTDPDDIQKAAEALKALELDFSQGSSLLKGSGYKTRSIEERLDDIHAAFADDDIKAVFTIRGGYGSAQLLDRIDYDLIEKHPKVFLGYSDITAMHAAIGRMTGLVTFHGPVLLSAFTDFTFSNLRKILFNTSAPGLLSNPDSKSGIRQLYPVRTLSGGKAEGTLAGGNLSIFCSLIGTTYEVDCKGKILVIEDVGEEPYRIDRMLNQLRLAGKLSDASGIIFGQCVECTQKSFIWDLSLGEVLDKYLIPLNKPCFYGLLVGHSANQLTLPIGIKSEMDADSGTLEITESAVI